jgi:hypothetical protein
MNMTPKFNLGDHVWYAGISSGQKQIQCPDCFGKKFLTVILGDDSVVTVECPECRKGYYGSSGTILSYDYETSVELCRVEGVEIKLGNYTLDFQGRI